MSAAPYPTAAQASEPDHEKQEKAKAPHQARPGSDMAGTSHRLVKSLCRSGRLTAQVGRSSRVLRTRLPRWSGEVPGPGLLGRSIVASVLVAAVAIVATALLTLNVTQDSLARQRAHRENVDQGVVTRLLAFGRAHPAWTGVDTLLQQLAGQDQKLVVTDLHGQRLAATNGGGTTPADPSAVLNPLGTVVDAATHIVPRSYRDLGLPKVLLDDRRSGDQLLAAAQRYPAVAVCARQSGDVSTSSAGLGSPIVFITVCSDAAFVDGQVGAGPARALARLNNTVVLRRGPLPGATRGAVTRGPAGPGTVRPRVTHPGQRLGPGRRRDRHGSRCERHEAGLARLRHLDADPAPRPGRRARSAPVHRPEPAGPRRHRRPDRPDPDHRGLGRDPARRRGRQPAGVAAGAPPGTPTHRGDPADGARPALDARRDPGARRGGPAGAVVQRDGPALGRRRGATPPDGRRHRPRAAHPVDQHPGLSRSRARRRTAARRRVERVPAGGGHAACSTSSTTSRRSPRPTPDGWWSGRTRAIWPARSTWRSRR